MDDLGGSIEDHLRGLEGMLLDPAVRGSPERVGALLAPGFFEIGSGGRVFGREEVIEGLRGEAPVRRVMSGFGMRMLSDSLALVTYRVERGEVGGGAVRSMRSSIWGLDGGVWKMVFHQGTVVAAAGEGG